MTRRPPSHHLRALTSAALACAALAAALPAAAGAAWTAPQALGAGDYSGDAVALKSNARGDAVTVLADSRGVHVARATAGRPFGARLRIDTDGLTPQVAIDGRGVALIAWEYDDGSFFGPDDFRGYTSCCIGTKVVVWRPGRRPSPARLVRPRGVITRLGQIAAVSGRRGLLVRAAGDDEYVQGALQFVPVGLDGRPGRRRTVPARDLSAGSLGFARGRAVVGLVDARGPSRLGVRSQRAGGSFGALRVFWRGSQKLDVSEEYPDLSAVRLASDGRGGQLAAVLRGRRPNMYVQLVRKPRGARARTFTVRRGRANDFIFGELSASPDGWTALAFVRHWTSTTSLEAVGFVLTVSPSDRIRVVRATATLNSVGGYAASVTRGGAGAAGFSGWHAQGPFAPAIFRASFEPLAGGRLNAAGTLLRGPSDDLIIGVAMTSNPRDRARAVWHEGGHVLASRLE